MTQAITDLVNYLLRFEAKTSHYASALQDCCLQISLETMRGHPEQDKHYFITFSTQGLNAIDPNEPFNHNSALKAHIRATPTVFFHLLLQKNIRQAMQQGLVFEGDPEALSLLEAWFRDCQIDWAEIIATYLGDSAAHSMETGLHTLAVKGRRRLGDLCANLSEYAVEEGLFPPRPLVTHFLKAVDALRASVERLEANLE